MLEGCKASLDYSLKIQKIKNIKNKKYRWDPMLEGCKGSLQYRYGRYKELKQVFYFFCLCYGRYRS